MASKIFYTSSMVSSTALENMISNLVDSGAPEAEYDRLVDSYRQHMISALEALDSRLWWQPETCEIFLDDDGSGDPAPDADDFSDWWNSTTQSWIEGV